METKKLFEFAKKEHKRLIEHYNIREDPKTKYTLFTKMIEEVGELSEALTTSDSLQRKDKLKKEVDLAGEIADVLFTTLILAEELNIDVEEALEKKMEKIRNRTY